MSRPIVRTALPAVLGAVLVAAPIAGPALGQEAILLETIGAVRMASPTEVGRAGAEPHVAREEAREVAPIAARVHLTPPLYREQARATERTRPAGELTTTPQPIAAVIPLGEHGARLAAVVAPAW